MTLADDHFEAVAEDAEEVLVRAENRAVQSALDDATRLAHSVKGVAANLGVDAFSSAAAALESVYRSGGLERPGSALEEWTRRLEEVIGSIAALEVRERQDDTGPRSPVDAAAVEPLLVDLAALLETDVAEAMDCVGELTELLANTERSEACKLLADHVENFEPDHALDSLRDIAGKLSIPLPQES